MKDLTGQMLEADGRLVGDVIVICLFSPDPPGMGKLSGVLSLPLLPPQPSQHTATLPYRLVLSDGRSATFEIIRSGIDSDFHTSIEFAFLEKLS